MEWLDIVAKLGLTGTSTMLAYAVKVLWSKGEAREAKHELQLMAKDAELKALNEKLTQILIDVSKRSDDD